MNQITSCVVTIKWLVIACHVKRKIDFKLNFMDFEHTQNKNECNAMQDEDEYTVGINLVSMIPRQV